MWRGIDYTFVNASSMYITYKVKESEKQVDTSKDGIRLKKGATLCFPKGGIQGDHVLLLTPAQINQLDNAQVEGRRVQICLSARQVPKNASYTGEFIGMLASLAARAMPLTACLCLIGLSKDRADRVEQG